MSMNEQFSKPKRFGQILDHTFQLSKQYFKHLMKIFFLLIGPLIALEAIIQLASGVSFFRDAAGSGAAWFEEFIAGEAEEELFAGGLGAALGLLSLEFISLLLFPIAQAAVLFTVNDIRLGETFTVGTVIKRAFSRFWGILGSTILFILILTGIFIVTILLITMLTFDAGGMGIAGTIIFILLLLLGIGLGTGLLVTRLSFYFGSVVLDKVTPGFGRSWGLTKGRTWFLLGLYIVFFLIITAISFAIETTFGALLGNSVLFNIVQNIALLFTTMIMSVGYAVMFLDAKTRNSSDDLKGMLDDYNKDS